MVVMDLVYVKMGFQKAMDFNNKFKKKNEKIDEWVITKPTKGIRLKFNKQKKKKNQSNNNNPIIYYCFIYEYVLKP
jgi:hypothetical protein